MLDYDLECLLVELELCATIALPCGKESNHLMGGGLYVGFEGFTEKLGKSKTRILFLRKTSYQIKSCLLA